MLPIHGRLAELYSLSCQRKLTESEEMEQQHCLQANAVYCWEMARLNNEAMLAARTQDIGWQQNIGAQMVELRTSGRISKRRK
ncbi:hypothetical protein A8L34_16870 [Bacillus sp. FJAT-27264]|uniref:DUF7667 family protein n=1 Tax=Paenibacillus sp. (strain DSM 101736 / FJAT-27264) TaxID=1850362 RepID=UPI000807D593|nr:hypothetical protein [Bacillus sp. FJAT-27264]OBZ11986.1 hypothetical protein A8L34_16870 [Bacillus sp. FJAT-27264]